MKNILKSLFIISVALTVMSVSTYAAWTASATVQNNTFSTGNAALRLYGNLGGVPGTNAALTQTLAGSSFSNLYPNWQQDYLAKLYNNGTVNLQASVTGVYVSEDADLRNRISVEVWQWNDEGDGTTGPGDTYSLLSAAQTLQSWRTNPVSLGQLDVGNTVGVLLRFTTGDLSNAYQGKTTVFDFLLDGTTTGATQSTPPTLP